MSTRRGRRAVLAAAAVVGMCPAVISAQPAAASSPCTANPQTPYMIDPQIYEVDAPTETVCNQPFAYVEADAYMYEWIGTTGTWEGRSSGTKSTKDYSSVWADAFTACKGENDQRFYTKGHAFAVAYSSYNAQDDENSAYADINCGAPPDPKGGAGGVIGWVVGG